MILKLLNLYFPKDLLCLIFISLYFPLDNILKLGTFLENMDHNSSHPYLYFIKHIYYSEDTSCNKILKYPVVEASSSLVIE